MRNLDNSSEVPKPILRRPRSESPVSRERSPRRVTFDDEVQPANTSEDSVASTIAYPPDPAAATVALPLADHAESSAAPAVQDDSNETIEYPAGHVRVFHSSSCIPELNDRAREWSILHNAADPQEQWTTQN